MISKLSAGVLRMEGMVIDSVVPDRAIADVEVRVRTKKGSRRSLITYKVLGAWSWNNDWGIDYNSDRCLTDDAIKQMIEMIPKETVNTTTAETK